LSARVSFGSLARVVRWVAAGESLPAPPLAAASRDRGFLRWLAASETLPPPPARTSARPSFARWLFGPESPPAPSTPGRREET